MSQYSVPQNDPDRRATDGTRERGSLVETNDTAHIASPTPLGLGMIGILTAIVGCFYAGFIIPFDMIGMRVGVGAALLIGSIVLVLAGMWEFRKGYLLTSTTFTSYGGFLGILGLIFLPNAGIIPNIGFNLHLFLGLLFLCWTIYLGILTIGAWKINASLFSLLTFLFVSYFFLMLGLLANDNITLLRIGAWFAIASALISWLVSLVSILNYEAYQVPFNRQIAAVE